RIALALQAAALVVLALALAGVDWLDARTRPRLLLLVDRSLSMPHAAAERAAAAVAASSGAAIDRIDFAGGSAPAPLEPGATDIEAALDAALAADARQPHAGVVVISDGLENRGDATRALRAARAAGLPLRWIALGRAPPPLRIAEVLAPARVRVGQRWRVDVRLSGQIDPAARLHATAQGADGSRQSVVASVDAQGGASLEFEARSAGPSIVDLALDGAGGRIDARAGAAVVEIEPRAPLLYVRGPTSPATLARSLQRGGWALDLVPAARLDARADALASYRGIVLDDVAIADAAPRTWNALVAAVRERGAGLLVLGGERAYARGGYRGSRLESVLPLASVPAALEQRTSVVFLVDKSGSMGQGSGGVDRYAQALRAVAATAAEFGAHDAIGLIVFDIAPHVLLPLGPAPAAQAALARDWPVAPGGGTRLAPALAAAISALERAGRGRRLLVVVSDGYVDEPPLAHLGRRLAAAHIETVALGIGADADLGALRRAIGGGSTIPVGEAAELPLAMQSGVERRRARIERGTIAVRRVAALPFAQADAGAWPAVDAVAVTKAQDGATVGLRTGRGDPLLAWRGAGLGRVMALSSALGPWTPRWLARAAWPRLAGDLAAWVGGGGGDAGVVLRETPRGAALEADVDPAAPLPAIVVDTPRRRGLRIAARFIAPGRLGASLPDDGPGLYDIALTTPRGPQHALLLRRAGRETGAGGISPALAAWRRAGWIANWNPQERLPARGPRPIDRTLIGLGLALFVGASVVDRWHWKPRLPRLAKIRALGSPRADRHA
ncbi:MAG: VWA domain-containing protein, partial [Burkholderiales bacterium]|nr:VWA domain-containing protein [Burkholderiales bacterium]